MTAEHGADPQAPRRHPLVSGDAWRVIVPTLLVVGIIATVGGYMLWDACDQPVAVSGISSTCGAYGFRDAPAIMVGGIVALLAGLLLLRSRRANTFVHTCSECGRVYRDTNELSDRRVRGQPVCSRECASRATDHARLEDAHGMIAELEAAARGPPSGVTTLRARERLSDLAARETDPVRGWAREALSRLERP